jgi:hypothetical protein
MQQDAEIKYNLYQFMAKILEPRRYGKGKETTHLLAERT